MFVLTETDPLNQSSTSAYDAAGYLRSTTDRLGRRIDYAFDDAGRKSTEKWYTSGGGLAQTQTWTYDADGRVLTAQDPDGTYTMGYDAAGRVASVKEPFGLSLTFGYDAVGNRTSVKDSTGGVSTVTFDARNMQRSEELGGTGVTPIKEERTYTDAGRLDTVTRYKSSFGFWSSVGSTTHAYDAAGRLTGVSDKDSMFMTLASYAYDYDAADRLTSETINGSQRTYTYDVTDQLTGDAGTQYTYDANGNRTMSGYATGTGNRMSNDGTWTYTYDAEGNVEKKSQGTMYGNWYYEYDHHNQMTGARYSLIDGGTVSQRVTYVYDAFGNRIERDAWDGTTATVERFGMDGWDPAKPAPVGNEQFDAWADLDGSNVLVTRRMYAPGFDEIAARESAAGAVGWYLTDHLGSVRGVTNGDGTPLTTVSYDAWGQVLSNSSPANSDRYLYTAREWDNTLTLWFYRARIRGVESFYSADPLAFSDGGNLYSYVSNNSTTQTDPSGRQTLGHPSTYPTQAWAWSVLGGGGGAAVGTGGGSAAVGTAGTTIVGWAAVGTAAASGIGLTIQQGLLVVPPLGTNHTPPLTAPPISIPITPPLSGTPPIAIGGTPPTSIPANPPISITCNPPVPVTPDQSWATNAAISIGVAIAATLGNMNACFAKGTPLRTLEGAKPIEDIQVGDRILSRDEDDPDGEVTAVAVDEIFVGESLIWHLHIGGRIIRTTAEHPFYRRGDGWVPANQLKVGDELLTEDGSWLAVEDMLDTGVWESVYNLRVGAAATYFVGCDEWGFSVWAHNICVYRGISINDMITMGLGLGIFARSPGEGNSIISHVAGRVASQWISTSKDRSLAANGTAANPGYGAIGVVSVDLDKVPSPWVDISNGIPGYSSTIMMSRRAINMQEVVIQDWIPQDAIGP